MTVSRSSAPAPSRGSNRIFYPDLIRVFAMFCILLYHFQTEAALRTQNYQGAALFGSGIRGINTGHIGVSLFFILSGASLSISRKPFSLKEYYKKRWFSIFPSYFLVWICAFLGTFLLMREKLSGIAPWTILLTLTGMDGLLYDAVPNYYMAGEWFTGCLILLYLIYPLLRFGMEKAPKLFLIMIMPLWGCLLVLSFRTQTPLAAEQLFYLRVPEFLAGMYLTRFLSKPTVRQGIIGTAVFLVFLFCPFSGDALFLIRCEGIGLGLFLILRPLGDCLDSVSLPAFHKAIGKLASVSYEIFLLHHFTIMLIFQVFFGGKQLSFLTASAVFILWSTAVTAGGQIFHLASEFFRKKFCC